MRINQQVSDWIWIRNWTAEDKDQVRIVCFRKKLELNEIPVSYRIRISASSRYKLYVNGVFVQAGPQKGIKEYGFWDSALLSGFLNPGKNVVAVEVLRYPENSDRRNDSLVHTEYPGLYIFDETEKKALQGREGWKCKKAEHIRLETEGYVPAPIHAAEFVNAAPEFFGWKEQGYDGQSWEDPYVYSFRDSKKSFNPFAMKERNIPLMESKEKRFREVVCCRECNGEEAERWTTAWNELVQKGETLTVAPNSRQVVELSAGELSCGYPIWKLSGGAGAKITVLWSECYYPYKPVQTMKNPKHALKGNRIDYENGRLIGYEETYLSVGLGTEDHPEVYEPYWFKTFRFLRVCVETGKEALQIMDFSYRSTGYPLNVQTKVQASDETFAPIWDICERTLRLCMHETYVDCPFYEQLQYIMDSRVEMLLTYTAAADDRLARQCMEDFRCSQQSNGLLKASAPTEWVNMIPGFSIFYIMMVHDHMMYFGDKELVKTHMNCIDSILSFFDRNLSAKGLVGKIGGILWQDSYWSFIDWTIEWNETIGVPTASLKGDQSLTIESLYYLYGLQLAADIMEFAGRRELAKEYQERGESLKEAIRCWCVGSNGLIQDGPGIDEYSVHCQLFAVLTGVAQEKDGRRILEISIGNEQITQCSLAFCFYLFRALEKVDWYEKADEMWNMWRKMLSDHMTTCVENTTDGRSECHGWGALLLYEMPAVYLGVQPAEPGFKKISVRPRAGHLTSASGDVITPRGMVHVEWTKNEQSGELDVNYHLPD